LLIIKWGNNNSPSLVKEGIRNFTLLENSIAIHFSFSKAVKNARKEKTCLKTLQIFTAIFSSNQFLYNILRVFKGRLFYTIF
jgi:hypothetical protein